MNKTFIRQLFLFGIVGTIGFVVDSSVLYAGLFIGFGPYLGRIISYICAASVTWYLNRRWTFQASTSKDGKKAEWAKFVVLNLGGFAVNYGTYLAALSWLTFLGFYPALAPLMAVAAGSVAGLFVNFAINKYLVFKA